MAPTRIVFLMYHELELPGRKLVQSEPGYVRYILPVDTFRGQMHWLKSSGFRGLRVSEAALYPAGPGVCITFDDGCETDLIAAAPILHEFGLHATFYLTGGFLGTPGYLNHDQVRELDSLGFEVGCHSMTHPYLSDLSDAELGREIVDSKLMIEQIVGHPIAHFSCPGGRYDQRTLETARRAGFRTVANSRFHANSPESNPYELGRVAMLRNSPLEDFSATCQGRGLWKKNLQDQARYSVRQLLGNRMYDRIRATTLGERRQ
ncbi:MAG TPA: polysaccharide deacetylase family protein [Terriglobales bacterium]|jgi:peptidoglycan/xylan/chitin deacetylase (PgdA/CDA1 family)|nr:polysaccharide deacetylase family protein [Terriglobales bacterium]